MVFQGDDEMGYEVGDTVRLRRTGQRGRVVDLDADGRVEVAWMAGGREWYAPRDLVPAGLTAFKAEQARRDPGDGA